MYMYTHVNTYMYSHTQTQMQSQKNMNTWIDTYTSTQLHTSIDVYVCAYRVFAARNQTNLYTHSQVPIDSNIQVTFTQVYVYICHAHKSHMCRYNTCKCTCMCTTTVLAAQPNTVVWAYSWTCNITHKSIWINKSSVNPKSTSKCYSTHQEEHIV